MSIAGGDASRAAMRLVACGTEVDESAVSHPSVAAVLRTLARRSLPHLLEATVIPTTLFWVLLVTIGAPAAMVGVFAWTFVALGRRLLRGEQIPAILLLATVGLGTRTLVGVASGSTFAYFVQPVATTLVLAGLFAGSVFVGRPVIARLASDFCHLDDDVAQRPEILRLFEGLTLLWAGVHALSALTTFALLVTLPTATFVALKSIVSLAITVAAIAITVVCAVRAARRENLVFAHA